MRAPNNPSQDPVGNFGLFSSAQPSMYFGTSCKVFLYLLSLISWGTKRSWSWMSDGLWNFSPGFPPTKSLQALTYSYYFYNRFNSKVSSQKYLEGKVSNIFCSIRQFLEFPDGVRGLLLRLPPDTNKDNLLMGVIRDHITKLWRYKNCHKSLKFEATGFIFFMQAHFYWKKTFYFVYRVKRSLHS